MAMIPVLGSRGREMSSGQFWLGLWPERKNTIGPCRDRRPVTEGEVCPWEPRSCFPSCRPSQVCIPLAESAKGPPVFIWFLLCAFKASSGSSAVSKGIRAVEPLSSPESFPDPVPQPPHFLWRVWSPVGGEKWNREQRGCGEDEGLVSAERLRYEWLGCWTRWRKRAERLLIHSSENSGAGDEESSTLQLCLRLAVCSL